MKARVLLISYHYMGVLYIDELLKAGDEIVGVVNWPGNTGFNQGWYVPEEYDVRAKALRHYLPLYEPDPNRLNSPEFTEVVQKLAPDYIVSGYYSKIFKKELLSIPRQGCINIHPTGLPRFRGLSPYFTHMLFGENRNYITMHWLDPGVDTGDIIAQASIEILPDDTGFSTGHRLTQAGAAMFREYWPQVKAKTAPRVPQDLSKVSTFNFSWDMAQIDWRQSNVEIWNLVRCLTKPLGGTWTMLGDYRMQIWGVQVILPANEVPSKDAVPGQVLAVTGDGIRVQCGQGQLALVDVSVDGLPEKSIFDALAALVGHLPVMLGHGLRQA
jgi:methionyl-tRNA formyltransferase